jgi:hypothetical protein
MISPEQASPGNGLILFFRVGGFPEVLARARLLVAALPEEPHVNPATGAEEFAFHDPDGYHVMVSANAAALVQMPAHVQTCKERSGHDSSLV